MNFHLSDLTVTVCAFDFTTHDCRQNGVNGGYRVVPQVKTFSLMKETLWLVFIIVEIKWPKVKHSSKTLQFFHEI